MPKLKLIPTGKLDKDTDLNSLQEGDYSDARNIIIDTGKNGGKDTIKILESIKVLGITQTIGTFKAALVNSDNSIYALYRTDSTNSAIYKYPSTLDSKALIIAYAHGVTTDFQPDFKIIGNTLVWNYNGSKSLLYWDVTRTPLGETKTIAQLLLVKSAPTNVLGITKTVTANSGSDLLELNDVQFAARYKYDTGEFSVLGTFSEMYKGEKDTVSYTVVFTLTDKPTYAKELELYVRKSKVGDWSRIYTVNILAGTATDFVWKGDIYETLSSSESDLPFSSIPRSVENIEIATNRIFVGNFEDDYTNDVAGTIDITVNTGYTLPSGGAIENYFGADTTDAGIKSSESGTYYKPFANNSSYTVGIVFMDSAMKTRGVEFQKTFSTGLFATPFAPTFTLSQTGTAKPTWAVWMQMVITENLAKGRVFEGYANSLYFEVEVDVTDPLLNTTTKAIVKKLSVVNKDIQTLKHLVLDITGMFGNGFVYSFNSGDRITLNCPNGTSTFVDGDGSATGAYRVLDMQVIASDGDKVYVEWNGGECLNDGVPDATKLYFEIYSPRQRAEDANLFFYGVGPLIDITSSIPSTVNGYKFGDTVFRKLEMNTYTSQILAKGFIPSVPAVITTDATTIINAVKLSGDVATLLTSDATNDYNKSPVVYKVPFTTLTATNQDEATLVGGSPQIKGFYDGKCTIAVTFNYQIVRTTGTGIAADDGVVSYSVRAYVTKSPYDQTLGTYGPEVQIGKKISVHESQVTTDNFNDSSGEFNPTTVEFEFTNEKGILKTGDRLNFYLDAIVLVYKDGLTGNTLLIKQKSGVTESAILTIIGNRNTPLPSFFPKNTVPVSASKVGFAVRSMGFNNVAQWSTSRGKAYVKASDKFTPKRTNAVRHSGEMIYGTDVNNISSFSPLDTVEVPQENGAIMSLQRASRLQGEGDMLVAVCQNESSYMLLGESASAQSDNNSFSALTSGIIGSIRNLGEKTGIQDKLSIYNHNGDLYWWDNFRNIVVEFTKRGVQIISNNGMRSHFVQKTGIAKFAVDPFYNLVFVNVGGTDCAGFLKEKGFWRAEYDLDFDAALHYGERCIYFSDGYMYRSLEDSSGNKVGDYLDSPFTAHIKMTANSIVPIMPSFVRVDHAMNVKNYSNANYVKSSLIELQLTNENGQATTIKEVNFLLEDNKLYAQVMRDINSTGGIVSGVPISGYTNNFKILLKDITQENRIFGLELTFEKVTGH